MHKKERGIATILIAFMVLIILILGFVSGYYYFKNKDVKTTSTATPTTTSTPTSTATATATATSTASATPAIDMGTNKYGDWSYKKINEQFSLYLPADYTVDTITPGWVLDRVGTSIASVTVPEKSKITSQKIDSINDLWFQFSCFLEPNIASMSIDGWITNFAQNNDVKISKITMVNSSYQGRKFQIQAISQPVYYLVQFGNYFALFTGGQEPGSDSGASLAEKVITTLKAN
ncbi:MAG: hypothetical protein M1338_00525 [Patescibacteria group bacterium]|nr:hypothetical protein [Patescibacteria group bacterium]